MFILAVGYFPKAGYGLFCFTAKKQVLQKPSVSFLVSFLSEDGFGNLFIELSQNKKKKLLVCSFVPLANSIRVLPCLFPRSASGLTLELPYVYIYHKVHDYVDIYLSIYLYYKKLKQLKSSIYYTIYKESKQLKSFLPRLI